MDVCACVSHRVNNWIRYCTDVFDYLTLAATIDGKVLCVHGGLSPDVRTIDQVITTYCDHEYEYTITMKKFTSSLRRDYVIVVVS